MVASHGGTKGRRKRCCTAFRGVRFLPLTLATVLHGTRLAIRSRIIRKRCPLSVRQFFDISRWLDIMGIGQEDTTDIPACKEMQGVYGSAVVGSGGQHTEPVKTVYEFADRLAVAAEIFRQLHIGSCDFSHLQGYSYAFDIINGLCPHGVGHQPVQAFLPLGGKSAFQNKIPLLVRKDGAVMYALFVFAHSL